MTSACSTSRERTGCQMNWITLPLLNLLSFFLVETQLAQQSHGKKTPKTLIMLILSIATGIVVITVILLVHIWYRRRKHSNKMQHVVGDDSSQHLCSCFPSVFLFAFWYCFMPPALILSSSWHSRWEHVWPRRRAMEHGRGKGQGWRENELPTLQLPSSWGCNMSLLK